MLRRAGLPTTHLLHLLERRPRQIEASAPRPQRRLVDLRVSARAVPTWYTGRENRLASGGGRGSLRFAPFVGPGTALSATPSLIGASCGLARVPVRERVASRRNSNGAPMVE